MSSVDNFNSGLAYNIRNNKIASAVNQINNSMAELAALRDVYMSELVPIARRGREISDPTPEQYASILNLSQIDNTPATPRQQRRLRRNAEEYFSQQPSSEQIVQGSTPYSPAQSTDQRQELAERYINDDSDWFGYISGVETKGLGQPRRLKNLTEEFESNYGKYFSDKNSAEYKRALGDYIMGLNTEMRQAANSRYGNDALKTRSFSIGMGVRGNQPATQQPTEQPIKQQTTEQASTTEQTPEITQEKTTGYKPSLKASKGNGTADWGEESQAGTNTSTPAAKTQVTSTFPAAPTSPTTETTTETVVTEKTPKAPVYAPTQKSATDWYSNVQGPYTAEYNQYGLSPRFTGEKYQTYSPSGQTGYYNDVQYSVPIIEMARYYKTTPDLMKQYIENGTKYYNPENWESIEAYLNQYPETETIYYNDPLGKKGFYNVRRGEGNRFVPGQYLGYRKSGGIVKHKYLF